MIGIVEAVCTQRVSPAIAQGLEGNIVGCRLLYRVVSVLRRSDRLGRGGA